MSNPESSRIFLEAHEEKIPLRFMFMLSSNEVQAQNYWTRITIKDGTHYKKDDVLNLILHSVFPHKIIPVKYRRDGDDTFFIFRNSSNAVQTLCSKNLKLYNRRTETTITLSLVLKYLPLEEDELNPAAVIDKVVAKRINLEKKVVDLRNFHNDPGLKDIFVPLSAAQCVSTVCESIYKVLHKPLVLLLSYNELVSLDILDYFRKISISVRCLDLRHNMITWSGFEKIPLINLRELWLEGNPLYSDFIHSAAELVKEVKRVIPSISKLDGVELGKTMPGDIVCLKTWFKNGSFDKFVDHFLHHYFSLFETERNQLKRIYHPEASLSISTYHLGSQSTSSCQRINTYLKVSRNLLMMSDIKKTYSSIYIGQDSIMELLNGLPTIIFDQFSFQVDVPITNLNKCEVVQINVCGAFKDLDCNPSALFCFDRTFMLVPWKVNSGEWRITNDMWSIMNASTPLAASSFKFAKKPIESDFGIMISQQLRSKDLLMRIVGNLTHMNAAWVQKFLGETGWNVEMTLQAFTDQYKANQIPAEAFISKKKE